jgi:hypothetical protein
LNDFFFWQWYLFDLFSSGADFDGFDSSDGFCGGCGFDNDGVVDGRDGGGWFGLW